MAAATFFQLEELPIELLQRVCLFLDDTSLSAFSVSNRRCHSAALFRLFRKIRLNIWDVRHMKEEIQQWENILARNSAYLHVQVLQIDRGLGKPENSERVKRITYWKEFDEPEAGELRLFSEHCMSLIYETYDRATDTAAWTDLEPLARLIRRLRALKSLAYGTPPIVDTVPQCVLRALQEVGSNVKLQMDNLVFRYDPVLPQRYGSNLTITPFLSSVALKLDARLRRNDHGYDANHASEDDYRENLNLLEVILQDAPNLKHLHTWWLVPDRVRLLHGSDLTWNRYPEFSIQDEGHTTHRLASLQTLNVSSLLPISVEFLEYWASRTEFKKLKVLKLESTIAPEAMRWLDGHCNFASLESLVLYEGDGAQSSRTIDYESMCHNYLVRFLQKLKPLSRLRLRFQLTHDIFTAIIAQHGQTLRQLWLEHKRWRGGDFVVSVDRARMLRNDCTVLEELLIPVERSVGNQAEVDLYRILGSISTVRKLSMILYAPTPNYARYTTTGYMSEPAWDDFDRQPYTGSIPAGFGIDQVVPCGSIRDAFANNAMDFVLAQAIFELISAFKPPDSVPLECLYLQTSTSLHKSPFTYGKCLGNILDNIAQNFCLERDVRDTHRNEISVRCANQDDIDRQNHYFLSASDINDELLIAIYTRLWPLTAEQLDHHPWWRGNWHSFPLAITRDEIDTAFRLSRHQPLKFSVIESKDGE